MLSRPEDQRLLLLEFMAKFPVLFEKKNISWAFSKVNHLETKCRRGIVSDKAFINDLLVNNCEMFF